MLFRRDLARSGSALACNILAGRPKGTHVAVVPRRANARQPPPPPARPKRAGRGSLGRAWDRGALAFACMRPHTHCMLPHARTARSHSTRHGGADPWHRPPRTAGARVCPAQACPESPAPCALRLTHLCPPSMSQRFDGAGGGVAPDVEGALIEAELARSLRWLAGPSNQAPASPGRSAARLTAAPRSLTGRIGCYPTGGPGSRPGRPLFTSVSCRRCLRVRASSLGHAWPSQASKWGSLS